MPIFLEYLITGIVSYLVGTISVSYFLSRVKGIDMKKNGSKNLGASNATLLLGKKAGIITCICDISKALIVVIVFGTIFKEAKYTNVLAGAMAIIGHMFPFYLKFNGGKGFASYLGTMLGLNWKFFLILLLLIVVVALTSDYIVGGTIITSIISPIYTTIMYGIIPGIMLFICSSIIMYKHRENFERMKNGTEFRISTLFKKIK